LRQALDYRESADLPAGARLTDVTLVPIADGAAAITHVLAARRDVTAKHHAEEALREADRRKDEFLAMLAHELRNPLAPIRNVAHLLAREALDTRTIRRSSELLQRQASQLARLVDDLLDVARITRGTIELKKETVSLERLLETALESVQPLLDVKQQTVRIMRPPEAVFVDADAVRLCQIFSNLLTNAAKYSPDQTEVTVTIKASADDADVTVQDQGRGIDPEMLPRIFDLFMQGDRSLDRREGGLGIGLTIVKHLVEMHGGRITAHSAGLSRGSSFRVQLPRARSTEPLPLSTAAAPHPSHSRRILIVEDNEDAAESLLMLLQMDGHDVKVEHEGSTALALLEDYPAEIAFIDIGLPGMDGYSLAQAIRARFATRALRLYAMTGYGRPEDRALALAAGFDEHLTKPVDPERLTMLLRAASRRSVPED
jgi:signal transduction histidine kinase/CheY-like chemotaxis protein